MMPEPVFSTSALGPDGRPLIEVWHCERTEARLLLSGSASVYEANVVIRLERADGTTRSFHVRVSAGGPDRGGWSITVPAGDAEYIVVGQEEMEEAVRKGDRRIRFATPPPNEP